jgi:NADH-quinone oxidoreductase subunit M
MIPLLLILFPLLCALVIMFLPRTFVAVMKVLTVFSVTVVLFLGVVLYFNCSPEAGGFLPGFLFRFSSTWSPEPAGSFLQFGIDGLSLIFLFLNTFVILSAAVIQIIDLSANRKNNLVFLNLILAFSNGLFLSMDLLVFYIFWELILLAAYFLQLSLRGREGLSTTNHFLFVSLAGGFSLLIGIVCINSIAESLKGLAGTNIAGLYRLNINPQTSFWLFIAFAFPFLLRAAIFPLHCWLSGLKTKKQTLGGFTTTLVFISSGLYAIIRILIPFFPLQSFNRASWILGLAVFSIFYFYLLILQEEKIKNTVGFLLPAQAGFVLLGFFSLKVAGISGAIYYFVLQSLVLTALFFLPDTSEENNSLRSIATSKLYYLLFLIPLLLIVAGLPPGGPFVGLFLIFSSSLFRYPVLTVLSWLALGLIALYITGKFNQKIQNPVGFSKIRRGVITILLTATIILGLRPQIILSRLQPAVRRLLDQSVYFQDPSHGEDNNTNNPLYNKNMEAHKKDGTG